MKAIDKINEISKYKLNKEEFEAIQKAIKEIHEEAAKELKKLTQYNYTYYGD